MFSQPALGGWLNESQEAAAVAETCNSAAPLNERAAREQHLGSYKAKPEFRARTNTVAAAGRPGDSAAGAAFTSTPAKNRADRPGRNVIQ